ncbi:MAG: hypothetical protein PHI84_21765 [Kiritimatiellae bacterium]|nr:hypothetical protein [Kiritimatiellia bacterium]
MLTDLKPRVDDLLKSADSVMIRHGISDIFALVDLLLEAGEQEEALWYMSVALKHNAWALNYQMRYAEIMNQKGETKQATEKARLVLDYAEKDELCERAQRILKEEPLSPIPAIQAIQTDTITLVLVPVGSVDRCVLYELQKELNAILLIPILLQDARVSVPEFKRDPVNRYLAEVRSNLLAEVTQDTRFASFLKERGLTEAKLRQDEGVVAACRHLSFESGGTNALAQFDTGMRQLAQAPKQWDMDDLFRNLKAAVQPFRKEKVYFMGVANLDAYMNQSNFIFGSAENNGHHALITYRRFTADFNGENMNRRRLVERTLKQVLSSLGFMLGVERCSTPTCARAYPHNLSEHDAKSRDLCPACRSGFERVLGVSLERKKTDQQRRP